MEATWGKSCNFWSDDEQEKGEKLVSKVKIYNLKRAVFNWAKSWDEVKQIMIANAWENLLYKKEHEYDLQGLEDGDYREILETCRELETKLDDNRVWFNVGEEEKGSTPETKGGIIKKVVQKGAEEEADEFKLSAVGKSLDYLLDFVGHTWVSKVPFYTERDATRNNQETVPEQDPF